MTFAATWLKIEILMLTEVKSKTDRQIPYDITSMWNLKCVINEPIYKTETDSQTQRTDLCCQEGEGSQWDGQGVWG